jgi:hypothetical protein
MTNLRSILGGVAWIMVSMVLTAAALEPVSLSSDTPVPAHHIFY